MKMTLAPKPAGQTTVPPQRRHWTRAEYHRLGELGLLDERRVELLNGEIYLMSPKNWPHIVACRKAADRLEAAFASVGWLSRQEPLALGGMEPEPDVAIVPGKFESYTDTPTLALFILEVADTSLDRDTTTKLELYAEAAIPEYWVLDLNARKLLVFRDPGPDANGDSTYRSQTSLTSTETVTPLGLSSSVAVADLLP